MRLSITFIYALCCINIDDFYIKINDTHLLVPLRDEAD